MLTSTYHIALRYIVRQRPMIPSGLCGADACGGGGEAGLT